MNSRYKVVQRKWAALGSRYCYCVKPLYAICTHSPWEDQIVVVQGLGSFPLRFIPFPGPSGNKQWPT